MDGAGSGVSFVIRRREIKRKALKKLSRLIELFPSLGRY
jgi:hypothetical protein